MPFVPRRDIQSLNMASLKVNQMRTADTRAKCDHNVHIEEAALNMCIDTWSDFHDKDNSFALSHSNPTLCSNVYREKQNIRPAPDSPASLLI